MNIIKKFKLDRIKKQIRKCRLGSPDGLYVEFPDYLVETPIPANKITDILGLSKTKNGKKVKMPLGHGMVIALNEDTGETRGSEYGRYDSAGRGMAKRVTVPNFNMLDPGNPTLEEMDNYARSLDKMYGYSGGTTRVHYIKGANEDKMKELMLSAESNNRETGFYVNSDYRILDHNCGTYGCDMIKKSMPWYRFSGFGPYSWGRPSGVAPYWGKTGTYENE